MSIKGVNVLQQHFCQLNKHEQTFFSEFWAKPVLMHPFLHSVFGFFLSYVDHNVLGFLISRRRFLHYACIRPMWSMLKSAAGLAEYICMYSVNLHGINLNTYLGPFWVDLTHFLFSCMGVTRWYWFMPTLIFFLWTITDNIYKQKYRGSAGLRWFCCWMVFALVPPWFTLVNFKSLTLRCIHAKNVTCQLHMLL